MTEPTIAELLAAAELNEAVELRGLIARLTAEGRLRGARLDGRAIGAAGLAAITVTGVAFDSRDVRAGSLFVAVPGLHADGHDFVAAAAAAGASAALVDHPLPDSDLPQLVVDDTRAALATAAAWWYRDPSAAAGGRRDHRDGRQDDDVVPGHGGARGGRGAGPG